MQRTYTYRQLAERIETELGVRPSLSTLRAAGAEQRRTTAARTNPRLTSGMPPKLPGPGPARFDAGAVDAWLDQHPRRRWAASMASAQEALAAGVSEQQVVHQARAEGLSWRHITEVLNAANPATRRSMSGIHRRYATPSSQS